MPELKLSNFSLGQSRDGALRQNKYWSLRDMVNVDIVYTDGRMRVRKGSARWNATALPAEPTQLFWWVDDDQNEHLFALCSDLIDRWYEAKASGAHQMIIDQLATRWCIAQPVGNRLILGTDSDLYWTDHDALTGGPPYAYRLGIKKPTVGVGGSVIITEGTWNGAGYPNVPGSHGLNATTKRKVAARFTAGYTQRVRGLPIPFYFAATDVTQRASIRATIYTDIGGPGVPLSSDAVSDWVSLHSHGLAAWGMEFFRFQDKVDLVSATDYYVVIEADDDYYSNYNAATFFMYLGYFAPAPANTAWNQNLAGTWNLSANRTSFWLGGIYDAADEAPFGGTAYYQYVMTYMNSTYGIESRPSDPLTVALRAGNAGTWTFPQRATVNLTPIAPVDPQVDRFRFYRRKIGDDPSIAESLITDTYKLVSEDVFTIANVNDSTADGYLGAELQTQNNYCYDDVDPADDSQKPVVLSPYLMVYWKGRVWMVELGKRTIWFSNILETNGASGYVGDQDLDHFALENKLDLALTSDVIALEKLSEDELAIYLRDEHVWVLRGGDEPLNPPPDFVARELLSDNGLIATRGVAGYMGRHIYLGRDAVGSFGGSQIPLVAVSSEANKSIFDAIEDQYIRNSVVRLFGNEIWFLIDTDNDGDLDTVMILDMLHGVPGEATSHRPWRTYRFSEKLNDIVVKRQFDDFRSMLGASAESLYILELGTGTTDIDSAITWTGETHDLRGENMVGAYGFRIKGKFPARPPSFTITATDHGDHTEIFTLTPDSSEDIRGQRTGLRFNRAHSVRAKIEASSTEADELLELALEYKEE